VDVELKSGSADLSTDEDAGPPRGRQMSGAVSRRSEGFDEIIEHDTVLEPWLCGGPLMNLDGKAIGMNIARAGRVSTYALPADLVKRILKNLQPAE
jgi:serine protease Do